METFESALREQICVSFVCLALHLARELYASSCG
jgi:hypothetical protein